MFFLEKNIICDLQKLFFRFFQNSWDKLPLTKSAYKCLLFIIINLLLKFF